MKDSPASSSRRPAGFALAFAIASWLWASLVAAVYQGIGGSSSSVPYNVVTLSVAIGQLLFAVTALSLGASVLLQRRPGRGLAIAAMVIAVLGLGVVVLALVALALVR